MHKEGFATSNLAVHPESEQLALTVERDPGTFRLATSKHEGRFLTTVASGDTLDAAPAWIPGAEEKLLFQSARIGRNPHGLPVGIGPYAIRQLDLASGDVETLLISQEFDYLAPRMRGDGTLLFIRRPYEATGRKPPRLADLMLDVVLFPYRFLRTLFYITNFFSMMFSGKPLATTLGAAQRTPEEMMAMTLWGRMIDTKKALAESRRSRDAAVVPKTWELVVREANGHEQVIAANVLSYDVNSSGDIVYTSGFAVFHITPDGRKTRLCDDELIEHVVAVES